jgi:hypothetical protein
MSYDDWKTRSDRDDEGRYGVSSRPGDAVAVWRCTVCEKRFTLGPATTHARQTGHAFTFKGQPVNLLGALTLGQVS